jgi:hypothetical protein
MREPLRPLPPVRTNQAYYDEDWRVFGESRWSTGT